MGLAVVLEGHTTESHPAAAPEAVEARIGNTPLLRLSLFEAELPQGVEIFAKAEHLNPGGSVKDRAALAMILRRRTQRQTPSRQDDSRCHQRQHRNRLRNDRRSARLSGDSLLPKNASNQRKRDPRDYGVEIIETDPMLSTDGAQSIAREIFAREAGKIFLSRPIQQRRQLARALRNAPPTKSGSRPKAASRTSSPAWERPERSSASTRRLKELNPRFARVAVQPESPMHGWKV